MVGAGALAVVSALSAMSARDAHAGTVFRKGPYLQNVTTDAISIMWETDGNTTGRAVVRSPGEADHVVDAPAARLHLARVTGLSAGRRYEYVVQSGSEEARGEFGTAPERSEPFSFVAFGDTRSNAAMHLDLVERVRLEVPDFILGTGDMVNEGGNGQDWQIFFDVERELLRDNVMFPSLGNHDREPRGFRTAVGFRRFFDVPAEGPDSHYAFTYGNSRILVLDSNAYSFALTDQTAWLEDQLKKARSDDRIEHVFVSMHHPPFSLAIHGGQPELREMWCPLFEKYAVDAVFSGHDHDYERSELNGVRYFVSGGGGAPLYPRDPRPAKQDVEASIYFERTYNYLRVQVVGDFVEVSAVRDDGTLIESTSWGKLPARTPTSVAATTAPAPVGPVLQASAVPAVTAPSSAGGCAVGRGRSSLVHLFAIAAAIAALSRRRR